MEEFCCLILLDILGSRSEEITERVFRGRIFFKDLMLKTLCDLLYVYKTMYVSHNDDEISF